MMRKNPLVVVLAVSALFFVVFLAVAVGTVMSLTGGRSEKKLFSGRTSAVGMLEIKGVITESKKALEAIEAFGDDALVKAVVVRINSPGGAVAPSQEIYEGLKQLAKKKPVYASMSSLAASGGYYVACGTKKIFANPGTITGSIGVIMQFTDASKLIEWAKVNPYNIKTGKFKDIGNPARAMTADEKALLQDMVDNVLGQFRRAVATARGLPMDKVVEISDGRIFSGEQAKEAKLVDELGGVNDTIDAIAKEAGIQGKPRIVYPAKKHRGLERFFSEIDDEEESSSRFGAGVLGSILSHLLRKDVADALLGAAEEEGMASRLIGPLFILPLATH